MKIKSLHRKLEKTQEINEEKVLQILNKADLIVLAWSKPEVKTISNLFY